MPPVLTVKRSEWLRGADETLLLDEHGKRDILGHLMRLCDVPDVCMLDVVHPFELDMDDAQAEFFKDPTPKEVLRIGVWMLRTPKGFIRRHGVHMKNLRVDDLWDKISAINDDGVAPDTEREKLLRGLFLWKLDIILKFED